MIRIIKKFFKKVLRTQSEYVHIGYNWSDSFKDYIKELFLDMVSSRFKFLGEKNKQNACSLFLKNVFLVPRKNEKTRMRRKDLFQKSDLRIQKNILKTQMWKKFSFPFTYFDANIYLYHNGLRLLKKNELQLFFQNKVAIDIGAYNGDSAFIFSQYKFKEILCFELDELNVNAFRKNIQKFSFGNIAIFQTAITNHQENVFYTPQQTASFTDFSGTHIVNSTSLDTFLKYYRGGDIGLIKMDIEGNESVALAGMIDTIKKYRPILLIALYHNANDFLMIPEFIYNLNCNYQIRIFKIQPFHPTDETFLVAIPLETNLFKPRYL